MSAAEKEIPRTQRMKQRVLEAPYFISVERARCYTETWRETEGVNPSLRAARAFANMLEKMTVSIFDDERITGSISEKLVGAQIPVERGEMNLILEMDLKNLLNRAGRPFTMNPGEDRELLREILPYWKTRTLRHAKGALYKSRGLLLRPSYSPLAMPALVRAFGIAQLKESLLKFVKGRARHMLRASAEIPLNNPNLVNNVFDVQGHLVVGHNRVIKTGFKGVRDAAAEKLKSALPEDNKNFLESVIICCDAARKFAERHAALARAMAEKETGPARREELLAIAAHAERVPWLPPRTFHEALQFLWFTELMALLSYGMTGICAIGRPDQYLLPFFAADIYAGRISEPAALELIEELLIKLSNNLLILPEFAKDTGSEMGADSMAPTVGGMGPNGADATNRLSCLFLDAVKNLKGMSNSYSARISNSTPPAFLAKISEVHAATSGLAVFNDEAVIPALLNCGCSIEDARDYAIIGCVEPTPQGNTFGCTSGNDISLVGALEMAFTRGKIRMTGRRTGPLTPDPAGFTSFDQLMDAFNQQLSWTVAHIAKCVNAKDEAYAAGFHNPFISATLEGCIENAEDVTRGGAKYNFGSISARGLATVADSLAAVKKFVFDEQRYTMRELVAALDTNFKGRESMGIFLDAHAPRYGTDNHEADAIARDVAATFCEEVAAQRSIRKSGPFRAGFFSYGMHVYDGSMLGATPDGRPAGRPVSNSLSPTNGVETLGPTAVFLSASKIDHSKISNGSSLNMKLFPALLQTAEGRAKFESMIKAWFALGGMHVQFNVVDNATLLHAQQYPELYRGLLVRVSGYSAYFTDLGRPLQDDIIRRTEFAGF